jgi:hypothetical protein
LGLKIWPNLQIFWAKLFVPGGSIWAKLLSNMICKKISFFGGLYNANFDFGKI